MEKWCNIRACKFVSNGSRMIEILELTKHLWGTRYYHLRYCCGLKFNSSFSQSALYVLASSIASTFFRDIDEPSLMLGLVSDGYRFTILV
jgi:hypothetical protein